MFQSVRSTICLVIGLTCACEAIAQNIPTDTIENAAEAHALFQKKGGLNAVKRGLEECWQNAEKLATYEAAIYCSAYNFTAANFDRLFAELFNAQSKEAKIKPTIKMADANQKARKALIAAGVDPEKIPAIMDEIRLKVFAATNRRY